ncbi:MAG TPA: roadblock/LC7 domain-containing protein [Motilibacteraceae bacterium]|nr:roadblock/LC7 domain-containing protein [Motilibacteraceae bacterium]
MPESYDLPAGPGRASRLARVLGDLLAQAPELEAAAVVTFDGLPMASALPPGMEEDRVAAMSAALLSLGERAAEGLGRGDLSQVFVEAEDGTVFLVSADDEAVLVAVAARGAKTGLMLYEVRHAAAAVAAALRADDPFTSLDQAAEVLENVAAAAAPYEPAYAEKGAAPGTGWPAGEWAPQQAAVLNGQPVNGQPLNGHPAPPPAW